MPKPTTLPGRRVGIHRKAGTEAPAPGRQNAVAPGTVRRPIATTTSPTTSPTTAAAKALEAKAKGRGRKG